MKRSVLILLVVVVHFCILLGIIFHFWSSKDAASSTSADFASPVLSNHIKVISAKSGPYRQLTISAWAPSQEDIAAAERYAAAHSAQNPNDKLGSIQLTDNEFLTKPDSQRMDYIDIGRKIISKESYIISGETKPEPQNRKAVVEMLLVCDMEWGKLFAFNQTRILDYFVVYFSEVSMRFRTLPGADVSFRITGIVVIENLSGQPFIEEARSSNRKADMKKILPLFSSWVYKKMGGLPKFDIAAVITNTPLEWYGGIAYIGTACFVPHNAKKHYGTLVFSDDGSWASVSVATHEIGHSLGSRHDSEIEGCSDRGFVMSNKLWDLQWFFSPCSNRQIEEFIRSENGECLQRQDERSGPVVDYGLGSVFGATMDEQCKRKLKDKAAFIPKHEDRSNCASFKCQVPGRNLEWSLKPVDNTICKNNGRCLRGRCRPHGSLVYNVGSAKCLTVLEMDRFFHQGRPEMGECKRPASPLERFSVTNAEKGKMLGIPWHTANVTETGDKCLLPGSYETGIFYLYFDRCDSKNIRFMWEFQDVGNGEFLLFSREIKRCAKDTGKLVELFKNCDRSDPYMRWKFH